MFKRTKKNKSLVVNEEITQLREAMEQVCPSCYEDNETELDTEIRTVLAEMDNVQPDSDEYANLVGSLEKLCKARQVTKTKMDMYTEMNENLERLYKMQQPTTEKMQIPWKEITVGVLGCVQIWMIIRHEEVNVITGKALGFVTKGRV